MEKSWIICSINDEPQDCLPRKLEVSQPTHYSLTHWIGEISKPDEAVIPITDEQNTATIKHVELMVSNRRLQFRLVFQNGLMMRRGMRSSIKRGVIIR
ncbi:hypothetical protein LIER_15941 [Lithospermum erythrorhizon]|uniref:Uncharacterized protein n=1 Tax=Lithospermum erythrorhizon TaxID=34254 RepID=A0AAV3Q5P6_LITER